MSVVFCHTKHRKQIHERNYIIPYLHNTFMETYMNIFIKYGSNGIDKIKINIKVVCIHTFFIAT